MVQRPDPSADFQKSHLFSCKGAKSPLESGAPVGELRAKIHFADRDSQAAIIGPADKLNLFKQPMRRDRQWQYGFFNLRPLCFARKSG
jgi:hypothetical protein